MRPFLDQTKQEVKDRKTELDEAHEWYKENKKSIEALVRPSQAAVDELHASFPTLVNRSFVHSDEKSRDLEAWRSEAISEWGKVSEEDDKTVDHAGNQVTIAQVDASTEAVAIGRDDKADVSEPS